MQELAERFLYTPYWDAFHAIAVMAGLGRLGTTLAMSSWPLSQKMVSISMRWIFIFAVTLMAHPTPSYASDTCGEAADTATMLACINRDLSIADNELNTLYGELLGKVQHWDRIDASDDRFETRLRQSQRAWISFRDAECTLRGSVMEGGSAQPLLENGCRTVLTKERNDHLRDLLNMF